jgi:hypothetical protein
LVGVAVKVTLVPTQIVVSLAEIKTDAGTLGLTVILVVEVTAEHGLIPVVVNVNVAVPLYPAGGVHVAFNVLAFGLNVPPAGVDQVPPIADPPTLPDNAVVVPP